MFLRVLALDNNEEIPVNINVIHVVSIDPVNPKNVDAGCFIFLRDGRVYETLEPGYQVQLKIDKIVDRFTGAIMVSFLAEYAKAQKPRRVKKS